MRSRSRHSRGRKGREVNGILLLDKPSGVTSNAALQEVKHAFKAAKAGHTGSLDPIATGLLPLCFGEATKVSSFFLNANKRYRSVFTLGAATETGDVEGAITTSGPVDGLSDADIEAAAEEFRGEFEQTPPMYSAVKFQGQPLYKLARQGIEVDRKPRVVRVYDLEMERLAPHLVQVDLHCSSGFYVRSLAHELGERLGCGAHVSSLMRTGVGEFSLEDAINMDRIREATGTDQLDSWLIPMDMGLEHIPGVRLSDDAAYYLCRGQPVKAADVPAEGWVRLYADEFGFLGLGMVLDDGRVAPKRLFVNT